MTAGDASGHPDTAEQPYATAQPEAAPPGEALTPDQARLLEAALPVCALHRLALAGPRALRAQGLRPAVLRPAELDLATGESTPLGTITADLARAWHDAGYVVRPQHPDTALFAGLVVTPPVPGDAGPPLAVSGGDVAGPPAVTVSVAKRPLAHPPVPVEVEPGLTVPVVSRDDAACLVLTAAAERTLPDDLLAVHALTAWVGDAAMPAMARAFDDDFHPAALAERLGRLAALDDEVYLALGAGPEEVDAAKRWALAWVQDTTLDLLEGREDPDSYYDHPDTPGAGAPEGADGAADSYGL
ncbi:hypothetical protein LO771_22060 [Streptacidiphilus sp. ASG 303]|uniref:hypothetical protein n=1 Tax=Streptacidiphilus sp. ASG 303 TaxID=2896847 RepID=UPI001E550B52|nr:hypothetical protein [Streptacidiphilus sp. ASG 303]MCD0484995.1 hypothetical protein [Streptacidiphilus sp. ASG 303]